MTTWQPSAPLGEATGDNPAETNQSLTSLMRGHEPGTTGPDIAAAPNRQARAISEGRFVVVPPTLAAVESVRAATAKAGGTWPIPRSARATLEAMSALGAVNPLTAVSHEAIAIRTGRKKGNQLRELTAAGYTLQLKLEGGTGHLFQLTPTHIASLRETSQMLGLDSAQVERATFGQDSNESSTDIGTIVFDPQRLRDIFAETAHVQGYLHAVMLTEEGEADITPEEVAVAPARTPGGDAWIESAESEAPSTSNMKMVEKFDGLPTQYHAFISELLSRPEWPSADLDALARRYRLMRGNAVDSVNDWSNEQFGDLLVDDSSDPAVVQRELLESI
jgi:hypothetical protein